MSLLHEWLNITDRWRDAFAQERTAVRAVRSRACSDRNGTNEMDGTYAPVNA